MTEPIDPYDVLGVAPDADEATIRKAYREKAKTAHPDVGGTDEEWEAVSRSLIVLTDPDLRRGYDETGIMGEKAIDNDRAAALQMIDQAMGEIVNGYLGKMSPENDPRRLDLVAVIEGKLNARILQSRTAVEGGRKVVAFLDDMAKRFTLPGRMPEENTISRNFESQARQNRQIIEGLDKEAEIAGMAIEIVRGYRFAADRAPEFFATSFGLQPRAW